MQLLYNYLTKERTDVLNNCEIRFTQPNSLNDPYECRPYIDWDSITDQDWAKSYEEGLTQKNISKDKIERLKESFGSKPDINSQQILSELELKYFQSKYGVLSLSESFDNQLMWSHYAQNHEGFVIGLDSENSFFNKGEDFREDKISKVEYDRHRPNLSFLELNNRDLFFKKSFEWKYEKEWRMIKQFENPHNDILSGKVILFKFPIESIKKIYLGANASLELCNGIVSWVNESDLECEVFKMHLNKENYNLEHKKWKDWLEEDHSELDPFLLDFGLNIFNTKPRP